MKELGGTMLGPKVGVPWATDDQWMSLKQEATRMSLEMEAKANAPEALAPPSTRGRGDAVQKKKPEEMKPAGQTSMVSVFWEPSKAHISSELAVNPYEGVLGPGLVEASVATSLFKRTDVAKLVKTPADVWKQGKASTTTHAGTLPGSHSELRATMRTPSHLRGLPSRSRTAIEQEGSFEGSICAELSYSMRGSERASSALGMLETAPGTASSRRPRDAMQGASEQAVMELRGEYNRLRKLAAERQADLEGLLQVQSKAKKDEGLAGHADGDIEDYRTRAWTRIEMLEDRLEQATRHSAALEEVQRRLKLVNKGLDHRLAQTKEELRGYNNDSKEMATMCKQIDAARDELSKRIRLMKAAMEQDRSKRTADMTRRQALVERSLAETNALGERVKAAEEEREKLQAEREAEEQLAEMRAAEHGTTVEEELHEIRERKAERTGGGKLKAGLGKVFARANTLSSEGALEWLGRRMIDHSEMVRRREDLEARMEMLKRQQTHEAAARRAHEEVGGEAQLEVMLADIEAFGRQSLEVAEAMNLISLDYVDWASSQIATLVQVSDDVKFLGAARRLTRRIPGESTDEDAVREWISRALPLVHSATADLLREAEQGLKSASPPGGPPSGPATGKAVVKSVGGAQSMQVSRGNGGGGAMDQLAPHGGFQSASPSLG